GQGRRGALARIRSRAELRPRLLSSIRFIRGRFACGSFEERFGTQSERGGERAQSPPGGRLGAALSVDGAEGGGGRLDASRGGARSGPAAAGGDRARARGRGVGGRARILPRRGARRRPGGTPGPSAAWLGDAAVCASVAAARHPGGAARGAV